MGDSLSTAWNIAINMKCLVLIGSVLACVSSVPFDAGYGVPAAPVIDQPALLPATTARLVPATSNILNPVSSTNIINRDLGIDITRTVAVPAPFFPPQPVLAPAPLPLAFPPQPVALPLPLAPQAFAAPLPAPVAPIVPPSSQFHAQDELGQFSFGYQNINSARSETKDAFGVTRGSYQYVDANNVVQTVHYTADDINGFRVAATNVPVAPAAVPLGLPVAPEVPVAAPLVPVVETPEVAAARAEHLAAHEAAKAEVAAAVDES